MYESYQVKLPEFEGPLDLLLHLVNELEIDIYDIPVSKITEQYMTYIHTMKMIELNIASEYLVMAATLLEIKSAMLLPKQNVVYEDEYEEDPREQLMERLIQYRKYKIAANHLKEQEIAENKVYTRPPVQFNDLLTKQPMVQGNISIYDMLHALNKVYVRKNFHTPLETKVNKMPISIEERAEEIYQLVEYTKGRILFDELFSVPTKNYIVITFLALLDLLKNNKIYCYQKAQFQPIYLTRTEGL